MWVRVPLGCKAGRLIGRTPLVFFRFVLYYCMKFKIGDRVKVTFVGTWARATGVVIDFQINPVSEVLVQMDGFITLITFKENEIELLEEKDYFMEALI